MTPYAWLNGAFLPERDARISIFDRGFLYGDTLYETLRTHRGRVVFWSEHARRLARSCELAHFEIDLARYDLRAVSEELARRNGLEPARIRITLSRGSGDPDQIDGFETTWVTSARPLTPPTEERYRLGVRALIVTVRRTPSNTLDPEIKSGNYLLNLLARREARLLGATEGIMLNGEGFVAEGASSNLFWVRGGRLETPRTSVGILHGVTRKKVLELAATRMPVEEVEAPPERLDDATEIFLTSTSWEALPITNWNGRVVAPEGGPVAHWLRAELHRLYDSDPGQEA